MSLWQSTPTTNESIDLLSREVLDGVTLFGQTHPSFQPDPHLKRLPPAGLWIATKAVITSSQSGSLALVYDIKLSLAPDPGPTLQLYAPRAPESRDELHRNLIPVQNIPRFLGRALMSFELVNTLATLGTFVVIAATAIAAIVQLRHTRGSNQIAALSELRETMESREFAAASQFVRAELASKLRDAAFRYQIANRNARTDEYGALIAKMSLLGNVYEAMGLLVKTGLVEQALVMEMWSKNVPNDWERLAPYIAIRRRATGDGLYENSSTSRC